MLNAVDTTTLESGLSFGPGSLALGWAKSHFREPYEVGESVLEYEALKFPDKLLNVIPLDHQRKMRFVS